MIFDQNDHVGDVLSHGGDGDDDVLSHQVPLLTADQKGPGLGATSGEKKTQILMTFHTSTFTLIQIHLTIYHISV